MPITHLRAWKWQTQIVEVNHHQNVLLNFELTLHVQQIFIFWSPTTDEHFVIRGAHTLNLVIAMVQL